MAEDNNEEYGFWEAAGDLYKKADESERAVVNAVLPGDGLDALPDAALGVLGTIGPALPFVSAQAQKEQIRRVNKQAEAGANAENEEKKGAASFTAQEVLIQNLSKVRNSSGPVAREELNRYVVKTPLAEKTLKERNKFIIPTSERVPPEDIVTNLLKPPDLSPFLQATPAQLSSLQPTLRFFIVSEEVVPGLVDLSGNKMPNETIIKEEEVFFSDHANADRIIKLANARASKTIDRELQRGGSEAGIRSFIWTYDNKHEGDYIIKAKLELYFGTLSELVNQQYIKFLFTNGKKTATAASISKDASERITFLKKKNAELFKSLHPGKPSPPERSDKTTNDFKQLKVLVGWATPEGNSADLERIHGGAKKLEKFKEAVRNTQTVILLNLTDYNVNFTQEGPTILTLDYVGSSDNYLSTRQSDILGENNFTTGNLNVQQVLISSEDIKREEILPGGYLEYQMNIGGDGAFEKETKKVPVNLQRLKRESDYLAGEKEIIQLRYGDKELSPNDRAKIKELDAQMAQVGLAYKRAKKSLRVKRYASLIDNLMGSTGNSSKIYLSYVYKIKEDIYFDVRSRRPEEAYEERDKLRKTNRLKKLAAMSDEERTKELKSQPLSAGIRFEKGVGQPEGQETQGVVVVPYVFLGDVILAAMQNCDMREDIKFLMGTYCPAKLGAPDIHQQDTANYSIYDIPIAVDFLSQFIYDNIIARNVDEYPFRQFLDQLLSAVTRHLNNLSGFKFRVSLDYTLYMTDTEITTAAIQNHAKKERSSFLLKKEDIKRVKKSQSPQGLSPGKGIRSYYVLYARQTNYPYKGDRTEDEARGVLHYTLGADRGIAKSFDFAKQDVPQFRALQIQNLDVGEVGDALVLPQNLSMKMFGNNIHRNGDLVYVDSRALLGEYANQILTLGGYYRVVRSSHSITSSGFESTVDAYFHNRTNNTR